MRKFITLCLLLLVFMASAADTNKPNIALEWDHSPDASVVGYNVYYFSTNALWTNWVTINYTNQARIRVPTDIMLGYFVTAYNSVGLESDPSNILYYRKSSQTRPRAMGF